MEVKTPRSIIRLHQQQTTLDQLHDDAVFNWKVVKASSYYNHEGINYRHGNRSTLVRSDDPSIYLGQQVGPSYQILQNNEFLSWIEPMIDRGYLTIAGYGYFGGGSKVFIQCNNTFGDKVAGDDIKSYLLVLNHHGGGALQINFCTLRVICQNTLDVAKNQGNKIAISHDSLMRDAMEVVHNQINLSERHFNDEIDLYKQMDRKPMNRQVFIDTLCQQFSSELSKRKEGSNPLDYPIIRTSIDNWDTLSDLEHLDNTAWKGFNAFNYVLNHGYGSVTEDKAITRLWDTGTYVNKMVAFKRLALK